MGTRRIAAIGRVAVLAVGLWVIGASPAWADNPYLTWNQPAATLLLPYFEVDLEAPGGPTTLFSINNASATAILAHVVIWSDLAVPVFQFNAYLTGYDVVEVDLGQLIRNGVIPETASAGQDPGDLISPHGPFSQDVTYPGCAGTLPYAPLTAGQLQALQAGLTGQFNPILGGCCGVDHGDLTARGYVTVDTVTNCTARFPDQAGYFTGDVTNQNVLYGDSFHIRPDAGITRGASLVHIQAAPGTGTGGQTLTDPATTTAGRYTFYGRYTNWNAADNRYPLATNWGARYRSASGAVAPEDALPESGSALPDSGGQWQPPLKSGAGLTATDTDWQSPSKSGAGSATTDVAVPHAAAFFNLRTVLEVWRDPKIVQHAFACPAVSGVRPSWFPLNQEGIAIFDEQEHPQLPPGCSIPPCPPTTPPVPFPLATQRVVLNSSIFPVAFAAGWLYLNLNTTVVGQSLNLTDQAAAQAWVTIVERGSGISGLFATGYPAAPLDTAQKACHSAPPGFC